MITGHTRIIAHIGVPTESFKAPMIYNPWFEEKGIDTVVVPMGCEAANFGAFLPLVFKLRNIAGALITMPHKVAVVPLLENASTGVKICGACNAVKLDASGKLVGDMFDGRGFVDGMAARGKKAERASAMIVGCGGAGSAIAAALAAEGVSELVLFDTSQTAMERLARRLRKHYEGISVRTGLNDPAGFDILANATPLGMKDGDPMPVDTSRISPDAFVGEVVMTREETPFLKAARDRGCRTQTGIDMLFQQIPAYLAFFGYGEATVNELRALAKVRY